MKRKRDGRKRNGEGKKIRISKKSRIEKGRVRKAYEKNDKKGNK